MTAAHLFHSVPNTLTIAEELLSGEKRIAVWGTGYIGYSTMAAFASKGVACVGTDIKQEVVDQINAGRIPVPNLEYWLGFHPGMYVSAGLIRATTNWKELLSPEFIAHMICVPTESESEPSLVALEDVAQKIARGSKDGKPRLVVIESTLTAGTTDDVVIPEFERQDVEVGTYLELGVAPRRDWFGTSDKNLYNIPRVVGGTTPQTTERMVNLLSLVCLKLLPARDHRHAELVKSIENAYRHVEITLANQLSLAYPHVNMTEVLELVGTKWNVGTYHPGFGCGGYCIPLSSKYVLKGADDKAALTILEETVRADANQPRIVAEAIAKAGCRNVGILGLSYKGDLKVHILSPTISMCKHFKSLGIGVKVNDPYYSAEEIRAIAGVDAFKFPEELDRFDALIIVSGHRLYRTVPRDTLIPKLARAKVVLDNIEETWADFNLRSLGVEYFIAGEAEWLSFKTKNKEPER